jgi:hypothetical protein
MVVTMFTDILTFSFPIPIAVTRIELKLKNFVAPKPEGSSQLS